MTSCPRSTPSDPRARPRPGRSPEAGGPRGERRAPHAPEGYRRGSAVHRAWRLQGHRRSSGPPIEVTDEDVERSLDGPRQGARHPCAGLPPGAARRRGDPRLRGDDRRGRLRGRHRRPARRSSWPRDVSCPGFVGRHRRDERRREQETSSSASRTITRSRTSPASRRSSQSRSTTSRSSSCRRSTTRSRKAVSANQNRRRAARRPAAPARGRRRPRVRGA